MKNRKRHFTLRMIGYFCLALAFQAGALPSPTWAKDQPVVAGVATMVDFETNISGVRNVPAGNPMPGVHVDAKVNNRTTDLYLGPASFLADCGMSLSKGDLVQIVGTISRSGEVDVVIVYQITSARSISRPRLLQFSRSIRPLRS